ncbi:MAG: hypothetical protein KDD33_04030 [Bdellovibrionales bacterium]|nr:hypothetical protein [Bdellovibrionales bacterium]
MNSNSLYRLLVLNPTQNSHSILHSLRLLPSPSGLDAIADQIAEAEIEGHKLCFTIGLFAHPEVNKILDLMNPDYCRVMVQLGDEILIYKEYLKTLSSMGIPVDIAMDRCPSSQSLVTFFDLNVVRFQFVYIQNNFFPYLTELGALLDAELPHVLWIPDKEIYPSLENELRQVDDLPEDLSLRTYQPILEEKEPLDFSQWTEPVKKEIARLQHQSKGLLAKVEGSQFSVYVTKMRNQLPRLISKIKVWAAKVSLFLQLAIKKAQVQNLKKIKRFDVQALRTIQQWLPKRRELTSKEPSPSLWSQLAITPKGSKEPTAFEAFQQGFSTSLELLTAFGKPLPLTKENIDVVLEKRQREQLWLACCVGPNGTNRPWALYGARLGMQMLAIEKRPWDSLENSEWQQEFWQKAIAPRFFMDTSRPFRLSGSSPELYREIRDIGETLNSRFGVKMDVLTPDESASYQNENEAGIHQDFI